MSRLPWLLLAFFAALGVATIALVLGSGGGEQDEGVLMVFLTGYAAAGALVARRQPRNAVGWMLLAVAISFGVQAVATVYAADPSLPAARYAAWIADWSWYVWLALVAVYLPLVFPTGRVVGPRWRVAGWTGAAAVALSVAGAALRPGELGTGGHANPFAESGALEEVRTAAATLGNVLVGVAFVIAAASLVVRFRRARGRERDQMKWFALVGALGCAALMLAMVGGDSTGGPRAIAGAIGWISFLGLALIGIPAATATAILRHRLYDIDLVIRRTLVYGALTATLAGTYLALVLLAGLAVGDSGLAVAASTLAVAALARPALARIQSAVDRRFYRRRYDTVQTLEAFGARLRDELDLDALGADLRGVVRDTVQPAHVSLWLRGPR